MERWVGVDRLGIGLQWLARIWYPLLAVAVSVALGSLTLIAIHRDPVAAFSSLLQGALGSRQSLTGSLVQATPLLFAGLAVGISFQSGVFNIGAGGQLGVGAIAAALIGGYIHISTPLVIPLMMLGGGLAGAVWGGIAGALRAYTGASEIITTLMLTYIASYLIDYVVTGPFRAPGQINQTPPLPVAAEFPIIVPNTELSIAFPLALVTVVAVWILLYRSTIGFELRMVGRNAEAAQAAGVSVKRVAILTMVISGFFAGLGGAAQIGGVLWSLPQDFSLSAGFDAIAISLLGSNGPIGILLASLFLGGLQSGSSLMEAQANVSGPFLQFLEAIMIAVISVPFALRWLFKRRSLRRAG